MLNVPSFCEPNMYRYYVRDVYQPYKPSNFLAKSTSHVAFRIWRDVQKTPDIKHNYDIWARISTGSGRSHMLSLPIREFGEIKDHLSHMRLPEGMIPPRERSTLCHPSDYILTAIGSKCCDRSELCEELQNLAAYADGVRLKVAGSSVDIMSLWTSSPVLVPIMTIQKGFGGWHVYYADGLQVVVALGNLLNAVIPEIRSGKRLK